MAESLDDIIRRDCLPLRDCMLTITDAMGEAAFLYFKEGELIEANYAALWGKEALAQIITWKLANYTVAPLPLGIKRSLWDQIENLLNTGVPTTASGRLTTRTGVTFNPQRTKTSSPFDRFKSIAGLLKIVQIDKSKMTVLYEAPNEEIENTDWLSDFSGYTRALGDTLGFGICEKWTIDTERYQVVGLAHDEGYIILTRRKDAFQEDLDAAVNSVLD